MVNKQAAGYLRLPGTQYGCGDCILYGDEERECMIVISPNPVLVNDGCNYFLKGSTPVENRLAVYSPQEVGFARSNYGFSCKRCEHFSDWDCDQVDRTSSGDDEGIIHPDACCNLWEADSIRGNLPTEAVQSLLSQESPLEP
jgi:hypothetical protein